MSVARDYVEAIYKEVYKTELDRAEKLDSQINLPTTFPTKLNTRPHSSDVVNG
jgi:hypothetical protein